MEHTNSPEVPSTIQTLSSSSSKKKKSKKEKKRKHDEVASPIISNGVSSSSSSSKKKKKERKRNKKDKVNTVSEKEQQSNSQELLPSSAAEIQKLSSQTTTQTNAIGGSIVSLLAATTATTKSKSNSSNLKTSPYQTKTIQGTVALLPSSLPDVPKCIQSLLNSLLLMYDANMGGVLLSLQDDKGEGGVKLLPIDHKTTTTTSNNRGASSMVGGRIVDDLPYIHYKFQFRGLLFCPSVGMKLTGQVVECTPTYITLTTHHILSTKISTEKLQGVGFKYDELSMEWSRERGGERGEGGEEDMDILGPSTSIYLDDIVEFVVERIHECGGYISLDGRSPSVSTLG